MVETPELFKLRKQESRLQSQINLKRNSINLAGVPGDLGKLAIQLSDCKKAIAELTLVKNPFPT